MKRLELEYIHERFSRKNIVKRFFRYIKQRTRRFYNNIDCWVQSIEDYASIIAIIRNLHITIKTKGGVLLG